MRPSGVGARTAACLALVVGGVDHQAAIGVPRMLGDDRGAGQDLDDPGGSAQFDPAADVRERHRVLPSLEVHQRIASDLAGGDVVERLWQDR